jgi:proton glutamate symport protein
VYGGNIPAEDRRPSPAGTGRSHLPHAGQALKRPSLSLQIAIGLLAGLGFGLLASATRSGALLDAATRVEPIGTLWVNLIRMVVIPLVMGAVIGGVAGFGDPKRLGRLGVRAILFFLATGAVGIAMGLALARLALPLAPPSPEAVAALRDAAAAGAGEVGRSVQRLPGLTQFLTDLVPANPVKAAADGALLPVIVFSVLFGLATAHLDEGRRQTITGLADAVVAAMVKLVGWFMVAAPLGVACLAAPVAARLGWGMLASFGMFIGVVVAGCLLFTAIVYGPIVRLLVRLPLRRFAHAVAPAWAVGFSTTSSMAALPALLEVTVDELHISRPVAGFVVPLAASLNRPASALYQAVAAVFLAQLYGVPLGIPQYATLGATMLLLTLSVPAMPRSAVLSLAPALLAAGVPMDGIGLLLGVDQVPDMFRTATNVAGHVTATAAIARGEGETLV